MMEDRGLDRVQVEANCDLEWKYPLLDYIVITLLTRSLKLLLQRPLIRYITTTAPRLLE